MERSPALRLWEKLSGLWKTPDARELAIAALSDRETSPEILARVARQKSELAAWILKRSREELDRLDEAERSNLFAPWRGGPL